MYFVSAFYRFVRLAMPEVLALRDKLLTLAGELDLNGLLLLSTEGINATVAGTPASMERFKFDLVKLDYFKDLQFKNSTSELKPFRRFKIDLREEIVTLKRPEYFPETEQNNHLSPAEWHELLGSKQDLLLIDVRNSYETRLGMFQGATDPKTANFGEFKDFAENLNVSPDKKILMYCTGGIRCEKAILEMQQRGFKNVFQLEGGILNYLEKYPEGYFEGECFVFDHRVSVDSKLQPSKRYKLCPHCGDPGDVNISCARCGTGAVLCNKCSSWSEGASCCKDCGYHLRRKCGTDVLTD